MDLSDLINRIGIKPSTKRNEALDTYIENSNQKREQLETLLSEFLRITSDKSAHTFTRLASHKEIGSYYNYLDKNINNFDFDLADVVRLTNNEQLYNIGSNVETNLKFGLFSSTLINKNIKEGEKVQIITLIPLHFLFYKLKDAEAYVNIAGGYLGYKSKNSKIYADEVGGNAGKDIDGCELHVKKAGKLLGCDANNSKIYAEEAGYGAGYYIKDCELHVKKAGDFLGFWAKNSNICADKAGFAAGNQMKNCELHAKKAGNNLGSGAQNSKIYADKVGNLDDSCFRGNNEIYLGEESYKKFIQNYPKYINKVKLWEKQKQNVDVGLGEYYGPK